MIVQQQSDQLVIEAPAKVNLHVEILGKRADGYHEIETLLVSVSLYDTLVFREQPSGTTLHCSDPQAGRGDDNLVMRAVSLVREETGCADGIAVDLTKRIPVAAGLAGGSSDAAATLVGLNQWWKLGWSADRLIELGARLGSDVAFFFRTPAALARGRGEDVTACSIAKQLDLVLVCPPGRLATADVFREVTLGHAPVSVEPIRLALEAGEVEQTAKLLHNRLEEVSLRLSPAVAELRRRASQWDCLGHLMTGSGSGYFAICSSYEHARALARQLRTQNLGSVFVVHTGH
jgi:4-diphosphocytidyl-2-C-methyl-D-erythritol kinase